MNTQTYQEFFKDLDFWLGQHFLNNGLVLEAYHFWWNPQTVLQGDYSDYRTLIEILYWLTANYENQTFYIWVSPDDVDITLYTQKTLLDQQAKEDIEKFCLPLIKDTNKIYFVLD